MSYLDATQDLYKEAALTPDVGLCCTTNPIWQFPGLSIPKIMQEMNYGCGSTVSAQDLVNNPNILYVGVGGGMVKGDALNLPVEDESIDVAAQNCLFNIFKIEDLKKAVSEMYRVLKPHGRLVMSDPICEQPMSDELRNDDRLRAQCLSGSIPLKDYVKVLTDPGFGTIEIRGKRSYRILSPNH